jgi:hypothetical protein
VRRIGTCAALAAAMVVAMAGPARADVFDDNPATASRGGGDLWVFARASDGEILERHRAGDGSFTDWSSLGGNAASGPAAIGYGSSILVFIRGQDGAVYQSTYSNGQWSSWGSLGGYATSAPAAEVRRGPEGIVDIAVKGGDNAIWMRSYIPGSGWNNWGSLGGALTSAPALNSQSAGIVNVWSRGTDGAVYQDAWNGSSWSGWASLGGGIIGAPAAVSRAENVVNIYARGGANATYSRSWTASAGWYAWALLDSAPLESAPAAGGDGPNHEWIVARGGGQVVMKEWTVNGGWGGWNGLGPVVLPAPPPVTAPPAAGSGEVYLQAGVSCTPAGGLAHVTITIRKKRGAPKPRVSKIVFYTKGRGRAVRVDTKAPWAVHIKVNRPAGSTGRVYARVYFRRSKHGKLHHKTVSRRYSVCR